MNNQLSHELLSESLFDISLLELYFFPKLDDIEKMQFKDQKMLVEAERIKKRVEYDIRMIRETGFVT